MTEFNAKGTMSVKNGEGRMVEFFPATDASCVKNRSGRTLKETIATLNRKLTASEDCNGVEIVHSEPTEESASSLQPETFIAWYKDPETDGQKHLSVYVTNDHENELLKVGDEVTFTYIITNDGGE